MFVHNNKNMQGKKQIEDTRTIAQSSIRDHTIPTTHAMTDETHTHTHTRTHILHEKTRGRDLEESGILRMLLGETRREPWSVGGGRNNPADGEQKDDEGRVPLASAAGGTFCAGYTVSSVFVDCT